MTTIYLYRCSDRDCGPMWFSEELIEMARCPKCWDWRVRVLQREVPRPDWLPDLNPNRLPASALRGTVPLE